MADLTNPSTFPFRDPKLPDSNRGTKSISLKKAARVSLYTLLKPTKLPFKINHSGATLRNVPFRVKQQALYLDWRFMVIRMASLLI
ncbi:hypothetical protein ACFO4N_07380 [Camelliibacillus cellulosilyticus]|uniref:Uncharacterized protein n=1 Tax=Camelliibacillus cellulosilyticus TaxID=2174486 RepID=A0ABV9GNQ3_9BACL